MAPWAQGDGSDVVLARTGTATLSRIGAAIVVHVGPIQVIPIQVIPRQVIPIEAAIGEIAFPPVAIGEVAIGEVAISEVAISTVVDVNAVAVLVDAVPLLIGADVRVLEVGQTHLFVALAPH